MYNPDGIIEIIENGRPILIRLQYHSVNDMIFYGDCYTSHGFYPKQRFEMHNYLTVQKKENIDWQLAVMKGKYEAS